MADIDTKCDELMKNNSKIDRKYKRRKVRENIGTEKIEKSLKNESNKVLSESKHRKATSPEQTNDSAEDT